MYIDFDIPVNPKLPDYVKEEIALIEEAYKNDDFAEYVKYEDALDSDIRDCGVCGIITDDEVIIMRRRFGWSL